MIPIFVHGFYVFSFLYVSTQCHRERRNCGLSRHFKIQVYSCLQRILLMFSLVRSFLCMYIRNGYQFSRVQGEHILNWILPILILITKSTFAPYNFLIRKKGGGSKSPLIFFLNHSPSVLYITYSQSRSPYLNHTPVYQILDFSDTKNV